MESYDCFWIWYQHTKRIARAEWLLSLSIKAVCECQTQVSDITPRSGDTTDKDVKAEALTLTVQRGNWSEVEKPLRTR